MTVCAFVSLSPALRAAPSRGEGALQYAKSYSKIAALSHYDALHHNPEPANLHPIDKPHFCEYTVYILTKVQRSSLPFGASELFA